MDLKDICPCPNLECKNQLDCVKCTSSHLSKKSLNACGFFTIKTFLEDAISKSPESPTALMVKEMIDKQTKNYKSKMEKYGWCEGEQEKRLEKMKELIKQ